MWRMHICISNYINVTSVSYGLLVFCSFEFWKQTILTLWIINDFSPGFLNSLSPTFYIQIQNRWGENVKYISFNKLISFLATFTLCVCHIASATKHLFPMHLLTVYLPLHHTPHQPPKQFFLPHLVSPDMFFCHIWQILFTLGRHFLLECEIFSVVMATTSYYYGLHLSPALLEMSRFISVCRLYNARAGEKGVALTSMILFEFKPVLY